MFQNPTVDQIRALLREVKTIAVLGLSDNPERPSYRVARAMQGFGYRIVPVRPGPTEVLGEQAYARLADLPEVPELAIVCTPPASVPMLSRCCRRSACPLST